MVQSIVKRDGRVVLYDERKIAQAIMKAMEASGTAEPATDAAKVANAVGEFLESHYGTTPPPIEGIQDAVERELMHQGYDGAAKKYILYRNERTATRDEQPAHEDFRRTDVRRFPCQRHEAGQRQHRWDTAMGTMLKYGCESAKDYYSKYLLTRSNGPPISMDISISTTSIFYALTTTCCQIDLLKLFKGGSAPGHGFLREPNDIQSYAALACIAIQSNQNDQHGGQSIVNFDYGLAPGVVKTYRRIYIENLLKAIDILREIEGFDSDVTKTQLKAMVTAIEEGTGLYPRLDTDPCILLRTSASDRAARRRRSARPERTEVRRIPHGRGDRPIHLSGDGGVDPQPQHDA